MKINYTFYLNHVWGLGIAIEKARYIEDIGMGKSYKFIHIKIYLLIGHINIDLFINTPPINWQK